MKKRFSVYIIVGILFGILDFYYQEYTQKIASSSLITWFLIACCFWLIPVIPIIIYEAKSSQSKLKSTLASALTWSISIASFYLFTAFRLIFIGQKTRPEVYIANRSDPYYWSNVKSVFLWYEFVEWIGVAVIGGGIVGFLVSLIYLSLRKKRDGKNSQQEADFIEKD